MKGKAARGAASNELELVDGSEGLLQELRESFPAGRGALACALFEDFEADGRFARDVLGPVARARRDPECAASSMAARGWQTTESAVTRRAETRRLATSQGRPFPHGASSAREQEAQRTPTRHNVKPPRLRPRESAFAPKSMPPGLRIRVFGGFRFKPVSNAQIEGDVEATRCRGGKSRSRRSVERYPDIRGGKIYVVADAE